MRAWPRYDPSKGSISTFTWNAVRFGLLDMMRNRGAAIQVPVDLYQRGERAPSIDSFAVHASAEEIEDRSEGPAQAMIRAEERGEAYRKQVRWAVSLSRWSSGSPRPDAGFSAPANGASRPSRSSRKTPA